MYNLALVQGEIESLLSLLLTLFSISKCVLSLIQRCRLVVVVNASIPLISVALSQFHLMCCCYFFQPVVESFQAQPHPSNCAVFEKREGLLVDYKFCHQCYFCTFSLITPLHYCSDYRPFFTIHDTEFKEYTTRTQAP